MRGTKIIHYATPKAVQQRLRQAKPYAASKKPHGYCSRLKRQHDFVLVKSTRSLFPEREFALETFCSHACGKKKFVAKRFSQDMTKTA